MPEPKEVGQFMLGIRMYADDKGVRSYKFFYGNENVPQETIITQVRAFLQIQEREFFDRFSGDMARIDKDM